MTLERMEHYFRWYCMAVKNPASDAGAKFIRQQADNGTWPTLRRLCGEELARREQRMYAAHVGCTSFSEDMSA